MRHKPTFYTRLNPLSSCLFLCGLFLWLLGCGEGDDGASWGYDLCLGYECFESWTPIEGTMNITGPGEVPIYLTHIKHLELYGPPELDAVVESNLRFAGQVDPGNSTGCNPFLPSVFENAVVLIERGNCPFEEKLKNAANAGAELVIVFDTDDDDLKAAFAGDSATIPATFIGQTDGKTIATWCTEHAEATIYIEPIWCPQYHYIDDCCQRSNPCNLADDAYCNCDGFCDWDIADCS